MFNTENKNFRINVVVFSIVGFSYYLYSFFLDTSSLKANPLYTHGGEGILISVIGASIAYYYFRYGKFPIVRIAVLSTILFLTWIVGVIYIGSNLIGTDNVVAAVVWTGLLTIMYFMFIGAINGLLGFWISLFNVFVAVQVIFSDSSNVPIVWTDVLGLIGIDNPVFIWSVVLISALLGISEKGYDFFSNQQA